jgi:hypothetical protein
MGISTTTVAQRSENEDLREFEGLTNYIEVLLATYPKPITRKELAEKMDVSQAAISKVRNRLLKLCDRNTLIFNRKLVLKSGETFWKLLVLFFLKMKPTQVLLSNYGREILKQLDIHSKISKSIKEYPLYFSEKDTQVIIKIALHNIKNFQIINHIKTRLNNSQEWAMWLSGQYISSIQSVLEKLDLPIENTEDVLSILKLRDKLFYLIRDLVSQQMEKMSIVQKLNSDEKSTYLQIYLNTVDFYLKRIFGNGTTFIRQVAENKKLPFKEDYEEIGLFFSPSI